MVPGFSWRVDRYRSDFWTDVGRCDSYCIFSGEWDEQLRLLQLLGRIEVNLLGIEYDKM